MPGLNSNGPTRAMLICSHETTHTLSLKMYLLLTVEEVVFIVTDENHPSRFRNQKYTLLLFNRASNTSNFACTNTNLQV